MFYDHLSSKTPPTKTPGHFLCKTSWQYVRQSAKPINAPLFLKISLRGLMSFNLHLARVADSVRRVFRESENKNF